MLNETMSQYTLFVSLNIAPSLPLMGRQLGHTRLL